MAGSAFDLWQRGVTPTGTGAGATPDLLRPFCAMALAARQRVGLSTPGTTFSQVLPPPRRPRPRCLPPRPSANASFADRAFGALLQREPRPRAPVSLIRLGAAPGAQVVPTARPIAKKRHRLHRRDATSKVLCHGDAHLRR